MAGAVFLDRDGVINALIRRGDEIDSPQRPQEFRLLPHAAAGVRQLNQLDLPVIVVSNQPGIAKAKTTPDLLLETTSLMHSRLAAAGATVTAVYYCVHHPRAVYYDYRRDCGCRKPKPGLLEAAAADFGIDLERSYMIGDREVDVAAGRAAGCSTVLVKSIDSGSALDAAFPAVLTADFTCGRLTDAAAWIASREDAGTQYPVTDPEPTNRYEVIA